MEWVETTAKTIDAAREVALDQLGVDADEAEIEIIEEPKAGLFGRTRGEARLRARVKPTPVRAKQERRRRPASKSGSSKSGSSRSGSSKSGSSKSGSGKSGSGKSGSGKSGSDTSGAGDTGAGAPGGEDANRQSDEPSRSTGRGQTAKKNGSSRANQSRKQDQTMSNEGAVREDREPVDPQEVGDAAVAFMDGLTSAFGMSESATLSIDGTELDVAVHGDDLGLLVGSGGRTLNAIQDLARVAAQRRLGDHETRLRIDVAGYRERRQAALAKFAAAVADEVRSSGSSRSMEPMNSADRKVIHDVLNEEAGVESRSEGEDPNRRIVVVPTD